MGRTISNFFMSLDGVVESPDQWHMSYFKDEMGNAIGQGMATNKAFLMGRVLYAEWAGSWPNSDDGDLGGFSNSHPQVRGLGVAEDRGLEQHHDHFR